MRFSAIWRGFLLVLICTPLVRPAAGEVDTTFNGALVRVGVGQINRTVIQPDGKILISGDFNAINTAGRRNLARLNSDGTLDTTFNPPSLVNRFVEDANLAIQAMALQADGKIVVGGYFSRGLKRLNADGSEDTAFNSGTALDGVSVVFDLKIFPDGRIAFSGKRLTGGLSFLTILNTNGTIHTDSNVNAERFDLLPDGKVVVFNRGGMPGATVYRVNQDLTPDGSFTTVALTGLTGPGDLVNAIVAQPDGKVVIGGVFLTINGGSLPYLARLNTNGTVDTSFNLSAPGPDNVVASLFLMPGGKILIGGYFNRVNNVFKRRIALLNPDASLDTSVDVPEGFSTVQALGIQTDGKIVAGGSIYKPIGSEPSILVRFDVGGGLDPTFTCQAGKNGVAYKVRVLPDNKVLVGGDFNYVNGVAKRSLARFNPDGTLDPTFDQSAFTAFAFDFDVFPDGKILVAPSLTSIKRLNADGSLDTSFVGTNISNAVKVLPDGKMLVCVNIGVLRRLNADGSIDSGFSATISGDLRMVYVFDLLPDGKILIGGTFTAVHGVTRSGIARLNANGSLDTSFNTPGGVSGTVLDIDMQPDGKPIISGNFTDVGFSARRGVARLNADGTLDAGFAAALNYSAEGVKIQPDGKILIGGGFNYVGLLPRPGFARLNTDGSLDTGFLSFPGADSYVNDIDLQSDGKIIMGGFFSSVNGVLRPGIVRLLNAATVSRTSFDYDGDAKSDISVFRPSENKWYVFRSSDSVVTQQIFAIAGDVAVPADYDGDGKTDMAVFRPSSGDWWSLSSASGSQMFAHWGGTGDIPRPSDFDGDGRADYVVFRSSDNNWYRLSSSTGASSNGAFGSAGDKPLIGDFDGDGKSDKAIYRASTGDWWWESSVNSVQHVVHWGDATDTPAPADYDGDGKTDMAVYRPSIGTWYILNSSNGSFVGLNFGLAEDKPVAADYDGDGRADISVFRPSTGLWYLNRSTAGFTATQFGISGDVPTENAFLP